MALTLSWWPTFAISFTDAIINQLQPLRLSLGRSTEESLSLNAGVSLTISVQLYKLQRVLNFSGKSLHDLYILLYATTESFPKLEILHLSRLFHLLGRRMGALGALVLGFTPCPGLYPFTNAPTPYAILLQDFYVASSQSLLSMVYIMYKNVRKFPPATPPINLGLTYVLTPIS